MDIDFAEYLLGYTERLFFKRTDTLSLLVAYIALFVSMASMALTITVACSQDNSIGCMNAKPLLIYAPAGILLATLIPVGIIIWRNRNNNRDVFLIERTILENYDYLNMKGKKDMIKTLNEFQTFYEKKGKNIDDLLCSLRSDDATPES